MPNTTIKKKNQYMALSIRFPSLSSTTDNEESHVIKENYPVF